MMGSTVLRWGRRVLCGRVGRAVTACGLVVLAMTLSSCRGSCGALLCTGTADGRTPALFGRAQARGEGVGEVMSEARADGSKRPPAPRARSVVAERPQPASALAGQPLFTASGKTEVASSRPSIARRLETPGTPRDPAVPVGARFEPEPAKETARGPADVAPNREPVRREWPTLSLSRPNPRRTETRADDPSPSPVAMSRAACGAYLQEKGVAFAWVEEEVAVEMPIRLRGPLHGIEYLYEGRNSMHEVMDCRLAAALYQWADVIEGVSGIQHFSIYRPGARVSRSGKKSGHASGLAIDVGWVMRTDGSRWSVENDWTDRRRGVQPCEVDDQGDAPMDHMRRWVCAAAEAKLFQVILTPHHDRRHHNHLHLELRPGVDWDYVR